MKRRNKRKCRQIAKSEKKLEKRPYQSLFTSESTEVPPAPTPQAQLKKSEKKKLP